MLSESPDQFWANLAQIVSAGALVVGAVVAVLTIRASRRASRRETTYHYLERQNNDPVDAFLQAASDIWRLAGDEKTADGLARYQALGDYGRNTVYRAFNFYEEVSSVYLRGDFDEPVFRELFGPSSHARLVRRSLASQLDSHQERRHHR